MDRYFLITWVTRIYRIPVKWIVKASSPEEALIKIVSVTSNSFEESSLQSLVDRSSIREVSGAEAKALWIKEGRLVPWDELEEVGFLNL